MAGFLEGIASKLQRRVTPEMTTINFDRVLGQVGVVTEAIDNLNAAGQVRVNGDVWTARSEDGNLIPIGCRVQVLRIEGVRAIVTPCAT